MEIDMYALPFWISLWCLSLLGQSFANGLRSQGRTTVYTCKFGWVGQSKLTSLICCRRLLAWITYDETSDTFQVRFAPYFVTKLIPKEILLSPNETDTAISYLVEVQCQFAWI